MTKLQARTLFNEVHAPCCMYQYAEIATAKPMDGSDRSETLHLAEQLNSALSDAVTSITNDDRSDSVRKLYKLIAITLKEIDSLEGRTNES